MKALFFTNQDIHSLKAIELLLPVLKKHQVKFILSKKVGNIDALPEEIINLKNYEQAPELIANKFEKIANSFGNNVFEYKNVNSPEALEDFQKFSPDLIISIRFGQIFKQPLINIPKLGVLNLHSGILPDYRGILASFWAILNGEKEIGTTLHYIDDATIDTGKIIGITRNKVDFSSSLFANIQHIYNDGCALLSKTINKIEKGDKIETIDQSNLDEGGYFSYPKQEDVDEFLKIIPLR